MIADRTDFRSLFSDVNVSAICTFPDGIAVFREHISALDIGKQLAKAFFVCLFNLSDCFKQGSNLVEALFPSLFRKLPVLCHTSGTFAAAGFAGRSGGHLSNSPWLPALHRRAAA